MTEVKVIGRLAGFVLGFGVAMLGVLVLSVAYRGVWMPIGLFLALGGLFAWHPRLCKAPGSSWFVAFVAVVGVVVWMLSVGPSPVRFPGTARAVPALFLLYSITLLVAFLRRNAKAERDQVIYVPIAVMLAALIWIVASFSGSGGGADPMIQFAMDKFGLSKASAGLMIIAFRKTVHFMGYGLIAWSAYRVANPKFDVRAAFVFGLGVALAVAIFDEFRQSTATNRTGSVWDVGLDLLGALTFLGFSVLRYRRRSQRAEPGNRLLA